MDAEVRGVQDVEVAAQRGQGGGWHGGRHDGPLHQSDQSRHVRVRNEAGEQVPQLYLEVSVELGLDVSLVHEDEDRNDGVEGVEEVV